MCAEKFVRIIHMMNKRRKHRCRIVDALHVIGVLVAHGTKPELISGDSVVIVNLPRFAANSKDVAALEHLRSTIVAAIVEEYHISCKTEANLAGLVEHWYELVKPRFDSKAQLMGRVKRALAFSLRLPTPDIRV